MSSITFNVVLPDFRKNAVKISKFEVRFVCKHDKLSNFLYESSQFPAVKFFHFAQKFSPIDIAESPFKGANPPFFLLPTESYIIYNSVPPAFPSFGKKAQTPIVTLIKVTLIKKSCRYHSLCPVLFRASKKPSDKSRPAVIESIHSSILIPK